MRIGTGRIQLRTFRAEDLGIDSDFNEKHDIHVHVPEAPFPRMVHQRV